MISIEDNSDCKALVMSFISKKKYRKLIPLNKEEFEKHFGKKMNVYKPEDIDWDNPPTNPDSFKSLSESLKVKCKDFVKH